tara:strand:- start:132793 stop:133338 length:546 start_codon:yes stop_codon:yes gene_type:complete
MNFEETPLKDSFLITPEAYPDARGFFLESFHKKKFNEATGLDVEFVQDNQSVSKKGVLRGLHFQSGEFAQAKLVRVIYGEVMDVIVDLRPKSPTFKKVHTVILSDTNLKQLFIPQGFAHGFITLSETSVFSYKCDRFYYPGSESGVIYNDPDLAIDWIFPDNELILSEKDTKLLTLKELFP